MKYTFVTRSLNTFHAIARSIEQRHGIADDLLTGRGHTTATYGQRMVSFHFPKSAE